MYTWKIIKRVVRLDKAGNLWFKAYNHKYILVGEEAMTQGEKESLVNFCPKITLDCGLRWFPEYRGYTAAVPEAKNSNGPHKYGYTESLTQPHNIRILGSEYQHLTPIPIKQLWANMWFPTWIDVHNV